MPMKGLFFIVALLPGLALPGPTPSGSAIAAEQQKNQRSKNEAWKSQPQKDKARPAIANPCAQYGDGFVQLQGTTTCVRMNGSIMMEMGTRGR
jgi:hypothetical protein